MKFSEYLIKKAESIWKEFLPHKFLIEMANNRIERRTFEKWFIQDYEFVKCALRFMNIISSKAPYKLLKFLIDSIYYIRKELEIFERKAIELKIKLDSEKSFICKSYCNFLISSAFEYSFFENFAIYYCEEKAYYEAWKWVKENMKNDSIYKEFIEHWSSDDFKNYVEKLEKILNEMAEEASTKERKNAEILFIETSKFEKLFWQMAYE